MPAERKSMHADAGMSVAHAALLETCDASAIGEHLAMHVDDHGFIVHEFACAMSGYPQWVWTVVLAHDIDAGSITVCDAVLLPGVGALVPPQWIPWSKRIQPGDLRPGDLLPSDPDDPRLLPGYVVEPVDAPGSADVLEAVWELGLGRERVLSPVGREDAAHRWWWGDTGPTSADARLAPHPCASCGFFVAIRGALGAGFGVCANEMSPADGRVVSVGFGCGAHSAVVMQPTVANLPDVTLDENEYEMLTIERESHSETAPSHTGIEPDSVDERRVVDPVATSEVADVHADSNSAHIESEAAQADAVDNDPSLGTNG